ncbi:hypothetical protein DICPUDRAFT_77118 [Dictyostelium purpureum]|uniref:Uncharacterized protein n=1 Tax=Dictyostelium purpureum TaxID=5786 RepID=F0ZFN1_DICPU|nr:uncharacterized protein DICPUDRAFT_77118 [Dictyostelium purpureum]EGC37261.1 hypothetical protein DICPUDRAFT_77118 [Dictyostelium purpureum]|eukprot:XP_003286231.1 hypothetical protein DICPUDRAFT_77118 [Dictyostelium purpureum]
MCLLNLMSFWNQYGFDPIYARGSSANHSYREKLHINIQKALKSMESVLKKNQPGLDNLSKMLEIDPVLYPVPLFKAPVVPSFNRITDVNTQKLSYTKPVVEIDVNMHARPFIYRVDGVNFIGDFAIEDIYGPRMVPKEKDQITDCYGFYLKTQPNIQIKLSEPKYVSIRLFTKMESNEFYLNAGMFGEFEKHDFESGSLASTLMYAGDRELPCREKTNKYSGFCISKKSETPISLFQVTANPSSSGILNFDKLLFLELVISDN